MSVPVIVVSSESVSAAAKAILLIAASGEPTRTAAVIPERSPQLAKASELRVVHTRPKELRLGEGCSCCTVRGDLLDRIRKLARNGSTERIIVHATPDDDLEVLAKTFTVADRDGAVLDREASLESLVMVVGVDDLDQNRSPRALVERIELATVVLLDGPGAGTDERARAAGIVGALNPDARITWTDTVPDALAVGQAAGDPRFDPDAARQRGALGDVLRGADPRGAPGISQFVFFARRPFHPTRLRDWLGSCPAGVLRARGTYWVASQPDVAAALDVAMGDVVTQVQGTWWAAVPAAQHPAGPEWETYRARVWHPTFGDRRQHITLITTDLDETAMRTALQDCLVTEAEIGQWGARTASPGSPPSTGAESR